MSWGLCLEDCPHEEPSPACLHPPPVPAFGNYASEITEIDTRVNYISNWFDLKYLPGNESYIMIGSYRERLHQPHWPYDPDNSSDLVELIIENNKIDYYPIYAIFSENEVANYTCPDGYIFENTHNITYSAVCRNWTWEWDGDFNESHSCVRKYC